MSNNKFILFQKKKSQILFFIFEKNVRIYSHMRFVVGVMGYLISGLTY